MRVRPDLQTYHKSLLVYHSLSCFAVFFAEAPRAKLLCLYVQTIPDHIRGLLRLLCRLVLGLKRGTISLGEAMKHLRVLQLNFQILPSPLSVVEPC